MRRAGIILLLLFLSSGASAKVPVCVRFLAGGMEDRAAFERLLVAEVRRHPEHTPVDDGCQTTFTAEYIAARGSGTLTGYLSGQVPARVAVPSIGDLGRAMEELVSVVLGSDPLALAEDTGRYLDTLSRTESASVQGVMLYGFEAFQTIIRGQGGTDFLPGLAFRLRRGLGAFTAGARASVSFSPSEPRDGERPATALFALLQPELCWYIAERATVSPYIGASAGLAVVRYDGFVDGSEESVTDILFVIGVRAGLELFRASDWRLDLFAEATIPAMRSHKEESTLVDVWAPSGHLGLGVAF